MQDYTVLDGLDAARGPVVCEKARRSAARRYHSVIMADKEPTLTFDERLNRIAWAIQEQSSLINSQIQLSHEHGARFAKVEAAIAALAEQSAKHDAARAAHEGRIGRLEAAMTALAEQSARHDAARAAHEDRFDRLEAAMTGLAEKTDRLAAIVIETERRWLAYVNTLPKQ